MKTSLSTVASHALATAPVILASILATVADAGAQERAKDQAAFFGLDKLWDVRLTVSEKDWKALFPTRMARGISRRGTFPYVPARAVVAGHAIQKVGLRFKGNSTYSFSMGTLKRPFKIDFNRYDEQQEFLGLTKLNLNNNATDSTQIREAISYQAYREAGVAASRTCFARVFLTITGRVKNEYLGMYTIIEQVDRRVLKRCFGSSDGLLVKPEGRVLPYYGETWSERYAASYLPKTTVKEQLTAPLIGLAKLLRDNDSKAFEAGIAKVMDVDQFLSYVAATVILANTDNPLTIPHNFYLAVPDRDKKVVWLPWDLNLSLGGMSMMGGQADLSVMRPARAPILTRVLAIQSYKDKYKAQVRKLIEGGCSAKTLTAHIKTAKKTTGAAISQEDKRSQIVTETGSDLSDTSMFARWGRGGRGANSFFRQRQSLEEFVKAREASVIAQLEGKSAGRPGGFGFGFGNRNGGGLANLFRRDDSSSRMRRLLDASGQLANQQDSFDAGEITAVAKKLFAKLDTNSSQSLDAKEITPALLKLRQADGARQRSARRTRSLMSRRARRMVRDLDTDKDGKLTVEEWLAGVDKWFAGWDTNRSGSLDRQELAGRGGRR